MAKITRRTFRTSGFANTTKDLRTRVEKFVKERFPGYVETKGIGGTFRDERESYGCDKLIIYAWYWRGEWADPTKEIFARFYLPKKFA